MWRFFRDDETGRPDDLDVACFIDPAEPRLADPLPRSVREAGGNDDFHVWGEACQLFHVGRPALAGPTRDETVLAGAGPDGHVVGPGGCLKPRLDVHP